MYLPIDIILDIVSFFSYSLYRYAFCSHEIYNIVSSTLAYKAINEMKFKITDFSTSSGFLTSYIYQKRENCVRWLLNSKMQRSSLTKNSVKGFLIACAKSNNLNVLKLLQKMSIIRLKGIDAHFNNENICLDNILRLACIHNSRKIVEYLFPRFLEKDSKKAIARFLSFSFRHGSLNVIHYLLSFSLVHRENMNLYSYSFITDGLLCRDNNIVDTINLVCSYFFLTKEDILFKLGLPLKECMTQNQSINAIYLIKKFGVTVNDFRKDNCLIFLYAIQYQQKKFLRYLLTSFSFERKDFCLVFLINACKYCDLSTLLDLINVFDLRKDIRNNIRECINASKFRNDKSVQRYLQDFYCSDYLEDDDIFSFKKRKIR